VVYPQGSNRWRLYTFISRSRSRLLSPLSLPLSLPPPPPPPLIGARAERGAWQADQPKKPTRVAAPSPRASLGRRTVCGRTEQRRPPVSKPYKTKVRMGVWGSFLIAAVALKTPTRNGYTPKVSTSLFASQRAASPGHKLAFT